MASGFDTEVGDKGSQLSGGYKRMSNQSWLRSHANVVVSQNEFSLPVLCFEIRKYFCWTRYAPQYSKLGAFVNSPLGNFCAWFDLWKGGARCTYLAAKGRATIAIAHRSSTIQNADCMWVVRPNTSLLGLIAWLPRYFIKDSSTHDELIRKKAIIINTCNYRAEGIGSLK
jgi:hypothetical protein